jgi:hypothetical protein
MRSQVFAGVRRRSQAFAGVLKVTDFNVERMNGLREPCIGVHSNMTLHVGGAQNCAEVTMAGMTG